MTWGACCCLSVTISKHQAYWLVPSSAGGVICRPAGVMLADTLASEPSSLTELTLSALHPAVPLMVKGAVGLVSLIA